MNSFGLQLRSPPGCLQTLCRDQPPSRSLVQSRAYKQASKFTQREPYVCVDELLQVLKDTNRGTNCTYQERRQIKLRISELEAIGKSQDNTGERVDGTWKLIWTTEQEILFILYTAFLFLTRVGDIFQVIDSQQERLQNVIFFPPKGSFIVNSDMFVADSRKVDFEFTGAALTVWGLRIPLPPRGEGWFENLYVDSRIRISRDIRGDYQVAVREGAVTTFT